MAKKFLVPIEVDKVTGLSTPVADSDAANKEYVDSNASLLAISRQLTGELSLNNIDEDSKTYVGHIYTGNGGSNPRTTGIESRDVNYAAGTSYTTGQLAFVRSTFKLWKALQASTGQTPAENSYWTEVDDGVVEFHQSSKVWIKRRTAIGANHSVTDTLRGAGNLISTDLTDAEAIDTAHAVDSFDSDGFTVAGTGSMSNANSSTIEA